MYTIVALWSRKVQAHLNTDNDAKLFNIYQIMQWVSGLILPMVYQSRPNLTWNQMFSVMVVLPEYYFSRTRQRSYERKAMGEEAKDIALSKLRNLSMYFPYTLLIPGTIAFKKSLTRPQAKAKKQSTGETKTQTRLQKAASYLLNNPDTTKVTGAYPYRAPFSPVVSTQTPTEKLAKLEQVKASKGEDDTYIYKNQAYVIQNGAILFKYSKRRDFYETYGSENEIHAPDVSKSATALIHNINFGLEICFDHRQGSLATDINFQDQMLKNLVNHNYLPSFMTSSPKVHVVVSDSVGNSSSPVQEGGFFIHASSDDSQTGVLYKKNGLLVNNEVGYLEKLAGPIPFDGDPLHVYLINLG